MPPATCTGRQLATGTTTAWFTRVSTATHALSTLVTFDGSDASLIADAAGNLYGTAGGGANGVGTIFEVEAGNTCPLDLGDVQTPAMGPTP